MPAIGCDAASASSLISALPLTEPDRSDLIETAKIAFERVIDRIEPENLELS
jgi:hypothetical protein